MLYGLPCSSKLSSRPPQLPLAALGMKAAFGRGDWRAEALQILSFQPRQTLPQPCEAWRGPWVCAQACARPRVPCAVCRTFPRIFRSLWQLTAALGPGL